MKLDEKYFIPFIGIVAVAAALVIVFFTISNRQGREHAFKENIVSQDSLQLKSMPVIGNDGRDSLSVRSFEGQMVVLDFWAPWTESFSREAHRQLAQLMKEYPGKVEVIAAAVEDTPEKTQAFMEQYAYPFHYVEGTSVFNSFKLPGVPTQLVYRANGTLAAVFTGYADAARMDSLQAIVRNE